MSWNFIGATLNLTHLAGMQRTYRVRFEKDGGEAVDMTNCTFHGAVADTDGNMSDIVCWGVEGEPFEIGLQFPELEAGSYRLEVWLNDDQGGCVRLFAGSLLVLGTCVASPSRVYSGYKTLVVAVPEEEGGRLQAQFLGSSAAEFSAVQAQREADRAKGEADRAARWAEGLDRQVDDIKGILEDSSGLFEAARSAAEAVQNAVAYSVSISEDETWVIGGVETGKPSRGRAGRSPYISPGGNWFTFSDEAGVYSDSHVPARGRDGHSPYIDADGFWHEYDDQTGMFVRTDANGIGRDGADGLDADSVVRHVVGSYSDIPQSGETCNGHHYYYISVDSGQEDAGTAYMWAETVTGQYGWVSLGMTWDIATVSRVGGAKLGSAEIITNGSGVGLNAAGQLVVPQATYNSYGTVKAGSAKQESNGRPYILATGVTSDGRLANNLLSGGALQHLLGAEWQNSGYGWTGSLDPGQYYLGLKTGGSFAQSQDGGLTLNAATGEVLGGVFRAAGTEDDRPEAVPNVSQVRALISSMAYGQGEIYTQAQTNAYVADRIAANNAGYYTKAQVDGLLNAQAADINAAWAAAVSSARADLTSAIGAAKSELQAWVQQQGYVDSGVLAGYVKASGSVNQLQVLTQAQHDALDKPDAKTLYISGGN